MYEQADSITEEISGLCYGPLGTCWSGGLLEWQALVEVVSVGLLANWLTEISGEY